MNLWEKANLKKHFILKADLNEKNSIKSQKKTKKSQKTGKTKIIYKNGFKNL